MIKSFTTLLIAADNISMETNTVMQATAETKTNEPIRCAYGLRNCSWYVMCIQNFRCSYWNNIFRHIFIRSTSVKIAENYCEKNGGSFNELIQTLLDNFIDEYGL